MSVFDDLDHLLKKKKDKEDNAPVIAETPRSENAAQNLAPAYDAAGNYLGVEAVAPPAANNAYGEDVIKALQATGRGVDAFMRGAADVFTVGNSDRLSAALGAATGIGGEFGDYSKNLATQRAASKADAEDRGPMRIMGQLAGGAIGPFKGARILQNATTLPGRVVGGAVAGGTAAAPYGYFSSDADLTTLEGQKQALKEGAKSGLTGAAIGGGVPVIGNAIGTAVDFLRNRLFPDVFSSLPRSTQRRLEQIARDADMPAIQSEATRLGPNSMLADVSPDMRLIAQNIATRPGAAPVVVDPLQARDASRNLRLQDALNTNLGPNVDRSRVTERLQTMRDNLGERYPQLAATTPDQMPAYSVLQAIDATRRSPLGRSGDVATAMDRIETVLRNPQAGGAYGRSAEEFHAARVVADGILNSPNTPDHVARAVRAVRNELDDALKNNVGGWKTLDARFSDVAGRQEAFQHGQTILNSGREAMRPDEYARYLQMLNPKQTVTERLGVRAELDRLAGQSGNDLGQFNRTLMERGDDNNRKLELLFGADKTKRLYDARDAERVFAETNNAVNKGSMTAQRMGANQMVSEGSGSSGAGAPTSAADMLLAARKKFADAIHDAMYGKIADDSARQLGRMTVAQGHERDQFIRALQARANRTDPEHDIERTLRALRPGIVAGLLR